MCTHQDKCLRRAFCQNRTDVRGLRYRCSTTELRRQDPHILQYSCILFLMNMITCPGCGVVLPHQNLEGEPHFNASRECEELCMRLSVYTISLQDPEFLHQHAVDAYEASHGGGKTKAITVVFGLIGLYLALEKGYTGKEVQRAHMELARQNKDWPLLVPPHETPMVSILEVVQAKEGNERNQKMMEWARAIWQTWEKDHQFIADLTRKYLYFE
jgi:hypothetical protein